MHADVDAYLHSFAQASQAEVSTHKKMMPGLWKAQDKCNYM